MDEGEMRLLDVLRRIGSGEGFPYVTAEEKLAAIQTYAQAQVADVEGAEQGSRNREEHPSSSPSQAATNQGFPESSGAAVADMRGRDGGGSCTNSVPPNPSQAAVLVVDRLRRICELDPFGDKLCALDQGSILKAADMLEGALSLMEKALQQMKAMREVIATAPPGTWGYNADGDMEEPHLTRTWANQDEHLHYADLGIAELETALFQIPRHPSLPSLAGGC